MPTERATYVYRVNHSGLLLNPLVGFHRPNCGTQFGVRGHVRALKAATCRRTPIITTAGTAKLPPLCHFPDSAAPTILRGLQRFDDSMADRLQNRQAS